MATLNSVKLNDRGIGQYNGLDLEPTFEKLNGSKLDSKDKITRPNSVDGVLRWFLGVSWFEAVLRLVAAP